MLSLNNVSVSYQKRDAVKDVTFELDVGQIGCLLGPSGCGKTSLLRAVAGFEKVQVGQIFLRKKLVSAKHCHI
jgi:iron(III) transport system ATP-binding protein